MPTLGSDHLPILVDIQAGPAARPRHRGPTKMSLKKANQLLFGTTADGNLGGWHADSFSLEKATADWIARFDRAAQTIPRGALPKPKGWW